jgi:hypothetical protein
MSRESPLPVGESGADSGISLSDSKIFLTVNYEYRYKLSCVVNVTGATYARENRLVTAKGWRL